MWNLITASLSDNRLVAQLSNSAVAQVTTARCIPERSVLYTAACGANRGKRSLIKVQLSKKTVDLISYESYTKGFESLHF